MHYESIAAVAHYDTCEYVFSTLELVRKTLCFQMLSSLERIDKAKMAVADIVKTPGKEEANE
jgi:hypothetical protein